MCSSRASTTVLPRYCHGTATVLPGYYRGIPGERREERGLQAGVRTEGRMGLPVLHVSRLVGGDGSGISDTADVQAARCMRAMGGAACEAAPMPLGPRQGTYRRFSGAGRGEVAAPIPRRLWADSGVCGLWACWREQVGGRLDEQRFDARQESRVSR